MGFSMVDLVNLWAKKVTDQNVNILTKNGIIFNVYSLREFTIKIIPFF